jgi:hypothetical protein
MPSLAFVYDSVALPSPDRLNPLEDVLGALPVTGDTAASNDVLNALPPAVMTWLVWALLETSTATSAMPQIATSTVVTLVNSWLSILCPAFLRGVNRLREFREKAPGGSPVIREYNPYHHD